jgi:hypothetical protein
MAFRLKSKQEKNRTSMSTDSYKPRSNIHSNPSPDLNHIPKSSSGFSSYINEGKFGSCSLCFFLRDRYSEFAHYIPHLCILTESRGGSMFSNNSTSTISNSPTINIYNGYRCNCHQLHDAYVIQRDVDVSDWYRHDRSSRRGT